MSISVLHQIIKTRNKFQIHSLGTFLDAQYGTWAPWSTGFQRRWNKRLNWALHGNAGWAIPSCVWLITKAKITNSIWTKNPGTLNTKGSLGKQTVVLSVTLSYQSQHQNLNPTCVLQLMVLSIPIPTDLENGTEGCRRSLGMSYNPRSWSVSLLPCSANCLKSFLQPRFCINS